MLRVESGISPEIIAACGYRTATVQAELRRLGCAERQCLVPPLVIPVWSPHGAIALYQSRPDTPRIREGKPVKYETLGGARMALDVHPSVRHLLADPRVPLFVTEGIKQGAALASRGYCAVALLGVSNWRGTNDAGGKVALADWECVALNTSFRCEMGLWPRIDAQNHGCSDSAPRGARRLNRILHRKLVLATSRCMLGYTLGRTMHRGGHDPLARSYVQALACTANWMRSGARRLECAHVTPYPPAVTRWRCDRPPPRSARTPPRPAPPARTATAP